MYAVPFEAIAVTTTVQPRRLPTPPRAPQASQNKAEGNVQTCACGAAIIQLEAENRACKTRCTTVIRGTSGLRFLVNRISCGTITQGWYIEVVQDVCLWLALDTHMHTHLNRFFRRRQDGERGVVEARARDSKVVCDCFRLAAILVERKEPLPSRQHQPVFVLEQGETDRGTHSRLRQSFSHHL